LKSEAYRKQSGDYGSKYLSRWLSELGLKYDKNYLLQVDIVLRKTGIKKKA